MNRGEFDYRVSSQEILYCKWKYNRPVRFIWNIHNTEQNKVTDKTTRWLSKSVHLPCNYERLKYYCGKSW